MNFSNQIVLATIASFLLGVAMIGNGAKRRVDDRAVASTPSAIDANPATLLPAPGVQGTTLTCFDVLSRLRTTADRQSAEALSMQPQVRVDLDQGQQFKWSLPEGLDLAVHCTAGKAVWAVSVYKGAYTSWTAFRVLSARSLCAVANGWSTASCEEAFDKTTFRAAKLHASKVYADLGYNRSIDYANRPGEQEFTIENTSDPKEMPVLAASPKLVWVDNSGAPIQ